MSKDIKTDLYVDIYMLKINFIKKNLRFFVRKQILVLRLVVE